MATNSDQTKGNGPQPQVQDLPPEESHATQGGAPEDKSDGEARDTTKDMTGAPAGDTKIDVETLAKDASAGLPSAQGSSVEAMITSTGQLANVDLKKPEEVLAASGNILNSYYTVALAQSARSFVWAVAASIVGLLLFVFAIYFVLTQGSADAAIVTAIAGAIVQVVAGLQFYLYGKTTEQAANHRFSLEKMQRFLLANSLIESLSEPTTKDESRSKLISEMSEEDEDQDNDDPGRNRDQAGKRPRSQEGTPGGR